jgi:hypothetical protein
MELFEKIELLVADTRGDAVKFFQKGNKSAGTRIRKNMQELKKLAQELRILVQNTKNEEAKTA